MSAPLKTATVATAPSGATFCGDVSTLLDLLLGAGEGGQLDVDARTEGGLGHQLVFVRHVTRGFLPEVVLTLLEGRADWHLRVRPAVRRIATTHPLRLHVTFARWLVTPVFNRKDWVIPADRVGAIVQRIRAFPLVPTVLLDGVTELTALWALATPLDLRQEGVQAHARAWQARFAEALGAETGPVRHIMQRSAISQHGDQGIIEERAACDPEAFVPLAGVVRQLGTRGAPSYVRILDIDPDRRYTVAALEAAIQATTTPATSPPTMAPRRPRQETS